MKLSIITVVLNRVRFIPDSINSVQTQTYRNIEHIVVDGGSSDGTVEFLTQYPGRLNFISEPDNGIYHALNKGLDMATGDIVGIMHSDDFYADNFVLADVASHFFDKTVHAVYGDLEYVSNNNINLTVRYWRAGTYNLEKIACGWMPPHPTFFFRRNLINSLGKFDTKFAISADYDFILRYLKSGNLNVSYIPRVLVKMRLGGVSNKSFAKIILKMKEDFLVIKKNKIGGFMPLFLKNISKIKQFF